MVLPLFFTTEFSNKDSKIGTKYMLLIYLYKQKQILRVEACFTQSLLIKTEAECVKLRLITPKWLAEVE